MIFLKSHLCFQVLQRKIAYTVKPVESQTVVKKTRGCLSRISNLRQSSAQTSEELYRSHLVSSRTFTAQPSGSSYVRAATVAPLSSRYVGGYFSRPVTPLISIKSRYIIHKISRSSDSTIATLQLKPGNRKMHHNAASILAC